MENFHLQNTDIKKIICDLGANCLNRIPFIFWPVHLNNRIHLQTEIPVCLLSVKYKCSSKEKTSCSVPASKLRNFPSCYWMLVVNPKPGALVGIQRASQDPAHLKRSCCAGVTRRAGSFARQASNRNLLDRKFRNQMK